MQKGQSIAQLVGRVRPECHRGAIGDSTAMLRCCCVSGGVGRAQCGTVNKLSPFSHRVEPQSKQLQSACTIGASHNWIDKQTERAKLLAATSKAHSVECRVHASLWFQTGPSPEPLVHTKSHSKSYYGY